MTVNFQMFGKTALMEWPKGAFLSSRKVASQDVMRYNDWAWESVTRTGGGCLGFLLGTGAPRKRHGRDMEYVDRGR